MLYAESMKTEKKTQKTHTHTQCDQMKNAAQNTQCALAVWCQPMCLCDL